MIELLSGLMDLINDSNVVSFDSIIQGLIGQNFIIDHYDFIKGNISAAWYNLKIQKYEEACQVVVSTYFQANERLKDGTLKMWYTAMSNKKSLQLLALLYKANVQMVQALDQALQKLTQEAANQYQ